ncbi:MAG: hypothetical protein HY238_11040 [Acidobacteria bacterium]|nr:hypothetical protein [Acidobacteriota bacterium]
MSLNLRRRHLNESQRAMLVAQLKERLAAEGRANWRKRQAVDKAALLMNISKLYI